jgi:hypothetical protein
MSTRDNYMDTRAQSTLELSRDRLDSWKQIAVYLGREVRTVQRWEKCEGLPVRRQFHVKGGTVWAFKHEIDAWFKNRCQVHSKPAAQEQPPDQMVNWSSPTLFLARQTGNSCWVWLVVARDSHRLDSQSRIVASDGNAERLLQQNKIRTQSLRTTTRDSS